LSASQLPGDKPAPSIERVWAIFAEIEARERLVDWRIGSIYLWPLLRGMLMREVTEQLGIFERRPPSPQAYYAPESAEAVARFMPADYAVVPFTRRDSNGLDPFSGFIVDSLKAHGHKPLVLGMGPEDAGSGRPQVENLEQEFMARYRRPAMLLVAPTLRKAHVAKYSRVIRHIESELLSETVHLGLDVTTITGPYRHFPRWLLVQFAAQRMGWKKFFLTAKVRKVFIVNAWKRALIAGAQAAGVTVVEPQHGAISGIHPYLSWAGTETVAYQPDEFLEWGHYWGEVAELPARTKRTVIGAPDFITDAIERESQLARQGEAHQPRTVLIASQAHASKAIVEFLVAAASAHPDFLFVLKQHPQEAPANFGPAAPANLQLADPAADTLDLMSRSEFVLGIYTTALFEALALGCKVGVLTFSGWQHIRALVERGDASLIEDQSALDSFLKNLSEPNVTGQDVIGQNASVRERAAYYYAKPASEAELWAALKIAE
jgi:hypothetical protein